ncbi:MAG TPA: formimidoylglutamate deiminase [Pyrinomonadaceae bacterium]|nr:formimidoylglutamate deiminase [Pyrinomonadaceae bacterium]
MSRAAETNERDAGDGSGTAFVPDLLYTGERFLQDAALVCDAAGAILSITPVAELKASNYPGRVVSLKGRALLPGLVNAHSHAFQRVIRGRTEYRSARHKSDSFWTWREMMYAAAARLTPEDLYDASRMAFAEMALCGITTVGEFHYLHRTPAGDPYDDPNLLARQVVRAARDTGLRIALLRVAYARSGFRLPPNERQRRFIETDPDEYLRNLADLRAALAHDDAPDAHRTAWVGLAPHSIRAVPLNYLHEIIAYADAEALPVHMHLAEQPAELEACRAEHRRTPVELLFAEGLVGAQFTAVHAVHITPEEARSLGEFAAVVCACPTTERNLGDGIVPADLLFREGVRISLGTDSQTQIDLLEDARELEYHLRLRKLERAVLSPRRDSVLVAFPSGATEERESPSLLAAELFECATVHGTRSTAAPGSGLLAPGSPADFFTVDLNDPSIAGASAEDLLAVVVFSATRTAVRDVCVGGRFIVADGRHAAQHEIVERFAALQRRLWS